MSSSNPLFDKANEESMEKVPCKECGAMILPLTAQKTGGYCMRHGPSSFWSKKGIEEFNKPMTQFGLCYNSGNALLSLKNNTEAMTAYKSAIAIWENEAKRGDNSISTAMVAMCLTNLGIAYARQGLVDEALATYNRSLEIRPSFLSALYNKALLLDNANRIADAIHTWELYLQSAQTGATERKFIPEAQRHLSLLKAKKVLLKHSVPITDLHGVPIIDQTPENPSL